MFQSIIFGPSLQRSFPSPIKYEMQTATKLRVETLPTSSWPR